MYRSVAGILFLLTLGSCGAAERPAATRQPIPEHDISLTLDPRAHRMMVQGVLTVPAALIEQRQIKSGMSGAAGAVRWSSADAKFRVHASSSRLAGISKRPIPPGTAKSRSGL
jgi:hypothetical protein